MGHVTLVIDSADVLDDLELFRLLALPDTLVREALRSAAEVLALIAATLPGEKGRLAQLAAIQAQAVLSHVER
jgi:hypothetical protein